MPKKIPKRDPENKLSVEQSLEQTKLAEKRVALLHEEYDLKVKIAKEEGESLPVIDEINNKRSKALEEAKKQHASELRTIKHKNEAARDALELAGKELELEQKKNSELFDAGINRQALHRNNAAYVNLLVKETELGVQLGKITKKEAAKKLEHYAATGRHIEKLSDISAHTDSILLTSTGIGDQWKDTIFGKVMMTEGGIEEVLKSLTATLHPANLLGSYMMKVQEATLAGVYAFSDATSSLNALTGAGNAYNSQVSEIAKTTRGLGVGWAGAASAIGELHSSMTGFTDLNESAQTELVKTTIGLSKLGISSSVTAKSMDDLMKGFGMSKSVAEDVQKDMAKMAIALGIPPAQMAESFASSMPHLASWGKEAPEIFKKVAGAAKKLGVQMDTLLSFSSQFDTFDSAATAVGKLNSILGGDLLNSYEMMNASAEERNEMLLESIELSGKSWESMNRFEQMAVANAAGITDMNEAQKLFSGGLSAYREGLNVTAASQEELERRQKAAASVTEKLTMLMESFAVAIEPLVSIVTWFVDGLLSLGPILTHVIIPMISAFALMAAATKAATIASAAYASVISAYETIYLKFLYFKDWWRGLSIVTWMQNTAQKALNFTTGAYETAVLKLLYFKDWVKGLSVVTWLQNLAQKALNVTTGGFQKISAGVVAVAGWIRGLTIVTWLQNVAQGALNLTTGVFQKVSAGVVAVAGWIRGLTIVTWLQNAAQAALNFTTGAASKIYKALTSWTWLQTAAKTALAFVSGVLGVSLGTQAVGQAATATTAGPAAAGTAAMGTAAWYAVIPIGLIALGLGLMALGFGLVAIAAAGIIYMMIEFVKLMIESPGAVIQMAGAMSILALTFLGFSLSLMGLALVLPLIPLVAAGIFAIGLAMRTIPESKTITFATAMSGLAEVATITPATVEGVRGVVEQAAAYLEIQAGFKAPDADAFVQALTKASEIQSQKSGTKGDGKDIVLVLNNREFGRAINVQLNSKHNVATR